MSQAPPRITTSNVDTGVTNDDLTSSTFPQNNDVPPPYTLEDVPPPAFGSEYGSIDDEQEGTRAAVGADGRVNIRINQKTKGLSSLLLPALRNHLDLSRPPVGQEPYIPQTLVPQPGVQAPPPLNVVIHVVGSRGDVQPFVALGKVLKEQHGHRVRLATHPVFRDLVTENGLEFFNIAGDPSELMAFMVKNPGLMPGFDSMRRGDIGKRRKDIGNMITRCWRSCIESGDGTGPEASDSTIEEWARTDGGTNTSNQAKPFVADAIIANPPSFAHVHCAEKLGIPLHMMFTMPWSPTQAFPHPLANIQSSNADASMTNFMSYALVDMMTWQGLGDIINRFRSKSLGLEPVSLTWAPGMLSRMKVPWTYCWSPTLIPKPRDWGAFISISGFYFLSLASSYTPDPELAAFLAAGPPPVYIGFGSIVVDDPNAMTRLIFDAVEKSGQRALVSKGWGGVGGDEIGIPEGVFMLGNVPHDWLFNKVSCVVHHGGAGTTAAGIACGKPTIIVPFFGDQPFWGAMVARAGAGPKPVPYKELTADILAESITEALKPEFVEKAKKMAESIRHEKGNEAGAQDFHNKLDVDKMRCTLAPHRAAVWRIKRTEVRLSAFAATVLGNEGLLDFNDIKLYRPREHDVEDEPWDPITGGASMIIGTMSSMAMGVADFPIQTLKMLKIHPDAESGQGASASASGSHAGRDSGAADAGSRSRSRTASTQRFLSPHRRSSRDSGLGSDASRSRASSTAAAPEPQGEAITDPLTNVVSTAEAASNPSRSPSPQDTSTSTAPKYDVQSALFGKSSPSPSPSASSSNLPNPPQAQPKPKPKKDFDILSTLETGHGLLRMASSLSKSPMDFTNAIARGFHNAPKLYGDTVRPTPRITSFSSGLAAAGKELGYGFYDGVTGLVTQPLEGARKEGAAGFFKGFGRGIGGVVLKPGAGIWGIPGYASKGIYKEIQRVFGPSVEGYIIASRTAQGMADVVESSQVERDVVIRRWKEVKPYLRKKKDKVQDGKEQLKAKRQEIRDMLKTKHGLKVGGSAEDDDPTLVPLGHGIERVGTLDSDVFSINSNDEADLQPLTTKAVEHARSTRERNTNAGGTGSAEVRKAANAAAHAENTFQHHGDDDKDEYGPSLSDGEHEADVEEAIRRSVQESSHGDTGEDAMIERAIRASVRELEAARQKQKAYHAADDDEELHRAIEASIQVARRHGGGGPSSGGGEGSSADRGRQHGAAEDGDEDDQLQRALAESKNAHDSGVERDEAARREEEIVLNYMMKQSLAEDEARRKRDGRGLG